MTELARYTSDLFATLEAETGQATGFRQNGSIAVALNDARLEELKRGASMARNFGLEVEVIGPADIAARYPILETRDARSEERRVGKECVSTCRSRGSPCH